MVGRSNFTVQNPVITQPNQRFAAAKLQPKKIALPLKTPLNISSPLSRKEIAHVDPKQITPVSPALVEKTRTSQPISAAKKTSTPSFAKRITAGAAAGAAAMLVPLVALAGNTISATTSGGLVGLLTQHGTLSGALAGLIGAIPSAWLSLGLAGAGLVTTAVVLLNARKALSPNRYQSPKSPESFNNPTPKKLFNTLVKPAWLGVTVLGTAFAFASIFSPALSWAVFGVVVGIPAARALAVSIRDGIDRYNFWRHQTQRNITRANLLAQIITNVWGNMAWASQIVFMAHLSKIFATQQLAGTFNFLTNLRALTLGHDLSVFGTDGIACSILVGGALLLYRAIVGIRRESIGKPLEYIPQVLKSSLKWGAAGAAIGGVAFLAGGLQVLTTFVCFVVVLGFTHNVIHSLRSQEGGLRQKDKIFPIFDLKSTWDAVQGPNGAFRTVYKPGVDMKDPLKSSYIMALISKGSNWVLNGLAGYGVQPNSGSADYVVGQKMVRDLINRDTQLIRNIFKAAYQKVKSARALATGQRETEYAAKSAAVEAYAKAYEDIARMYDGVVCESELGSLSPRKLGLVREALLTQKIIEVNGENWLIQTPMPRDRKDFSLEGAELTKAEEDEVFRVLNYTWTICGGHPMAWGDLRARSGLPFLGNGEFTAGTMQSTKGASSDQDLREEGELIRFQATLLRKRAATARESFYSGSLQEATLESLTNYLVERLNVDFSRAFPHADTHPGRFHTNFLPDSYNAKQFLVDLNNQVMADFVGAMEVVVMDGEGKTHLWLLPMRVVKDVKPEYRQEQAGPRPVIESRDSEGEDLRFGWYERDMHDVGDSLCEIAYIDNLAHYNRHKEDISLYPTAEVVTPPTLSKHEYYDVVYKDGARLRIYGDGSQRIETNLGIFDDPATITRIMQERGYHAVLMVPGTQRHQFVAQKLREGKPDEVLFASSADSGVLSTLSKGVVPHAFGGNYTDRDADGNCYLLPRWRFNYPTEYTSVSDADQMDHSVTNLRLFHVRQNPHLRVMMKRPKQEEIPYSNDLRDDPNDSFLEVGVALSWMMLKVKLIDGRELFMPLNLNKENERTFGGDLWKYIDETKPLQMHKGKLGLNFTPQARKDPAFRKMERAISWVDIPLELQELADQIAEVEVRASERTEEITLKEGKTVEVHIDPVRYGEIGGPIPVADYLFTRRNEKGMVVDRDRKKEMPVRIAKILIDGNVALLSEREVDHVEMVEAHRTDGRKRLDPRHNEAWTDKKGTVHIEMSQEEYGKVSAWLTPYRGSQQPEYKDGELKMDVMHFRSFCENAYWEFTYRRFMPDEKYRTHFMPEETE